MFFLILACSKKEEVATTASAYDYSAKLPYDTTAIDSFSAGATPNNMILNRVVIDSATRAKLEEQKIAAQKKKEADDRAKAKLEEESKKKEEDKKKADEAAKKKKQEAKPAESIKPEPEKTENTQ